jgi:hypothetical protein
VARGAGAKASANRRDAVVELAQNFHELQTGLGFDLVLFAVTIYHSHSRHQSSASP